MKILFDENVPARLKFDFGSEIEIITVQEMNWQGKKNGELLGLMTFTGFDCFITLDQNLQYQQNLKRFRINIIVLDVPNSRYSVIQLLVPRIKEILSGKILKQITIVSV